MDDAAGMVGMVGNNEENIIVFLIEDPEEDEGDVEVVGGSQMAQESSVNVGFLVDADDNELVEPTNNDEISTMANNMVKAGNDLEERNEGTMATLADLFTVDYLIHQAASSAVNESATSLSVPNNNDLVDLDDALNVGQSPPKPAN